ncbi:BamA/TamA family outer membrane protein [Pontibacter sp. JH31]|uniref:BamA/TamA family outer membrane protein n=1 Tax=Pontibacter aquaedesilientis TaxID=2766980 RepID=A0ABR7XJV9_9BACT|nr:BamA/TamA family outer membrane protein [Pontibacter aquaedesilientis]MBD1398594.1 BamA/TamA family outer membrane protein [Pontibacter aquaedesilientis]
MTSAVLLRVAIFLLFALLSYASAAQPCDTVVVTIDSVNFVGNEASKARMLLFELNIAPGDTLQSHTLEQRLEENRKRLYNLRLFHEVGYTYTCHEGRVTVRYTLQERWYLYPIPIFDLADRNFNAWLERRDWGRVDYGINLIRRNFRGRNEEVRLRLQQGFNKRLEFVYRVPYISRRHRLGLDVGVADYRSRAIDYRTLSNRQRFLVQDQGVPIQRTLLTVGLIHRQSVQRQEGLRLTYVQEQVSDTVLLLNPDYYNYSAQERQYLRVELSKVVNLRNSFVYPLTGSYFEATAAQTFFIGGSGAPMTTLRAKYVDYRHVAGKYYYFVGGEAQTRLSGRYAYADNVALGFRSSVRGYELNVVGGQHFALLKQGLTRELLQLDGLHLKFIKSPKFNKIPVALYANAFTDAGYVVDDVFEEGNPLSNRLLLGAGAGLHLVTFYDFVFRAEYAINREGTKGFYLSGRFPF